MQPTDIARRYFFSECGYGLGKIALAGLLTGGLDRIGRGEDGKSQGSFDPPLRGVGGGPHFAPKAKRLIHLFMAGAPSHLDLFDPKPKLAELQGKPIPPEVYGGQRYAFIRPDSGTLGPQFTFAKYGQSGAELSEAMPHLTKVVDDICFIRSMHTDQFNHAPAQIFLNTGFAQPGRPSMGSWLLYGLGSETRDLPAFVVMSTGSGISGGAANWSSGFLPTTYGGVRLRNSGDPILNVSNPEGIDVTTQSESLKLIQKLNKHRLEQIQDPDIAARIASYEMAFRLQSTAPELMDLAKEDPKTIELYGCDPAKPSFARSCLLARRMIEMGVRVVTIYHEGWDAHSDVVGNHRHNCKATDQASAALVQDLKDRGLLDDTLIVWGGEFGRTPMIENSAALGRSKGRDHHPQAYTIWMAGGGIKGGMTYGATDDLGFHVVDKPVHIHDLQATILHLMGLDHERLTYTYQGRQFRLTDVHGHVVRDILA